MSKAKKIFIFFIVSISLQFTLVLDTRAEYATPALKILLIQAQDFYVFPLNDGWQGIDEVINKAPEVYASIMGLLMQKQKSYLIQYPGSYKQFNILQNEIISLFPKVAQSYNNNHPNDQVSSSFLEQVYYQGLRKRLNPVIVSGVPYDPTYKNIPFMLNQVVDNRSVYRPPANVSKATSNQQYDQVLQGIVNGLGQMMNKDLQNSRPSYIPNRDKPVPTRDRKFYEQDDTDLSGI